MINRSSANIKQLIVKQAHPDHESKSCLKRRLVTRRWIEQVVVELNLCPFARKVLPPVSNRSNGAQAADSVALLIDTSLNELVEAGGGAQDQQRWLLYLIQYLEWLRQDDDVETIMLVLPDVLGDFDDYLDFLALSEALIAEQGFEGEFQLASFHPHYCFDGANDSDPANYTNRSPYPMLQILRESSVEKAVDAYPDIDEIPQTNMRLTRELGLSKMQQLLRSVIDLGES